MFDLYDDDLVMVSVFDIRVWVYIFTVLGFIAGVLAGIILFYN